MLLAGIMMGVALAGLHTVADRGQEFASPGRYNEVWQSYNLSRQVMSLAATADAVASGAEPPERLKLRLGVMRTALLPLLRTHIFAEQESERPQIQATLTRLDLASQRWNRELSWQETAAARELATDIAATLASEGQHCIRWSSLPISPSPRRQTVSARRCSAPSTGSRWHCCCSPPAVRCWR